MNVTKSEAGNNTGSCGDLVDYLEKENRFQKESAHEKWFNQDRDDIGPKEVMTRIDANIAKLKKTEAKFFLVNISPSEKELAHIGQDPQKLKAYSRQVMEEYAKNFQKGLEGKDLLYYGKVEYNRYYKFSDDEVQEGKAIKGDSKPGSHMHVQIIVSRKDQSNSKLLSPLNNSSGRNEKHSKKFGQFNGVNFKQNCEVAFDSQFEYKRELQEGFRYQNTMQNGSISEKADMILALRQREPLLPKEKGLSIEGKEIPKKRLNEEVGKELKQELHKEKEQQKSQSIQEKQELQQTKSAKRKGMGL